jgi:hypothetical protein
VYSFHHFHSRQQQHFFSQAKATWLVAKILAGYTRLGPAETVGSELKCHSISAAKRKITRVIRLITKQGWKVTLDKIWS